MNGKIAAEKSQGKPNSLNWTHDEGTFDASRRCVMSYLDPRTYPCRLYWQAWKPAKPARGVIALVHGFGEHSGRYGTLVEYLCGLGYAIYTFDHRGHGRSPGLRGYISDWADFREDLLKFLEMARAAEPNLPLILYGHSMGGLQVLDHCLYYGDRFGAAGVISTSAPLAKPGVKPYLFLLSKILSRIPGLGARLQVGTHLDKSLLSHDPAMVQRYRTDPLSHSLATPSFGEAYERTRVEVLAGASRWKLPLLMMCGSADRVAPPQGVEDFYARVPAGDKKLIIYLGAFHEVHNEIPEYRERMFTDLRAWLDRRLAVRTQP